MHLSVRMGHEMNKKRPKTFNLALNCNRNIQKLALICVECRLVFSLFGHFFTATCFYKEVSLKHDMQLESGADLGFSRGADFQKKFRKLWRPFFLGRPNWLSSPKALFCINLANFWKKSKAAFLGTFWKVLTKKNLTKSGVFFGACSPSKLVFIGGEGAFRNFLGSVGQKRISEKVSKVGRGSNPWGGASPPHP